MRSAVHDRSASIFLFLQLWSVAGGGGNDESVLISDFQMLAGM